MYPWITSINYTHLCLTATDLLGSVFNSSNLARVMRPFPCKKYHFLDVSVPS